MPKTNLQANIWDAAKSAGSARRKLAALVRDAIEQHSGNIEDAKAPVYDYAREQIKLARTDVSREIAKLAYDAIRQAFSREAAKQRKLAEKEQQKAEQAEQPQPGEGDEPAKSEDSRPTLDTGKAALQRAADTLDAKLATFNKSPGRDEALEGLENILAFLDLDRRKA